MVCSNTDFYDMGLGFLAHPHAMADTVQQEQIAAGRRKKTR